jgi:hypothetical protein
MRRNGRVRTLEMTHSNAREIATEVLGVSQDTLQVPPETRQWAAMLCLAPCLVHYLNGITQTDYIA